MDKRGKKIISALRLEIYEWIQIMIAMIPGRTGVLLRSVFYKLVLGKMEKGVEFYNFVKIEVPQAVHIGYRSAINNNVRIAANLDPNGGVVIGKHVLIGPYTVIHSANHGFSTIDIPIIDQTGTFSPVIIEDDVWIGAHCVVLPGVTIKKGTIVAAGSVVNRSTEEYSVVAGVPARFIKSRINNMQAK